MKLTTVLFLFLPIFTGAQVRYGYFGDTLKGNIRQMTENGTDPFFQPPTTIYTCDTAAKTETIAGFNKDGDLSEKILLQLEIAGQILEKTCLGDGNIPRYRVTYRYDRHGRVIYECKSEYPSSGNHWAQDNYYALSDTVIDVTQYQRDTAGRVVEEGRQTSKSRQKESPDIVTTAYVYDSTGRVTRRRLERQNGIPGMPATETTDYEYDDRGRKTVEYFLSEGGDTTCLSPFYCDGRELTLKISYEYDDMNNVIKEQTQMLDRQRQFRCHPGNHIATTTFHTFDNDHHPTSYIRCESYQAADGTIVTDDSVHREYAPNPDGWKNEYDGYGNIVKETNAGTVVFSREIVYY